MNLLLIDLDDTLIDTGDLKKRMIEQLAVLCQTSESAITAVYNSIRNPQSVVNWFNKFSEEVAKQNGADLERIKQVIVDAIPQTQVHQHVLHFVKDFNGHKVIFSFGDPEYQKKKITLLGLNHFFDQILITEISKLAFLESYEK